MKDAKAWAVKPRSGMGVVRIRVVVDPRLPTEPDATWLQAQLVVGLGFNPIDIEPATMEWKDPND